VAGGADHRIATEVPEEPARLQHERVHVIVAIGSTEHRVLSAGRKVGLSTLPVAPGARVVSGGDDRREGVRPPGTCPSAPAVHERARGIAAAR
jgi:hypothetical protein